MSQSQAQVVIEDDESFQDFRDALSDYAPKIELLVAALRLRPDDPGRIADLFRTFHNIKGDASLCRLGFLVPFVHASETLLARVRAGEVPFSPLLADVLLLAMDRLQLAIDQIANREPMGDLHLPEFTSGLEAMHTLSAPALNTACQRLIGALTGVGVHQQDEDAAPEVESIVQARPADLAYFRQLALQLELRSPLFSGRTERNLKLALLTNQFAGGWVDNDQLCAAMYLHDVGMMFLPETLWVGGAQLSEQGRAQMCEHVAWAAGLLQRMPGWEEAARMVLQHHEKPDGTGYPHHLSATEIVPGAKIIALVDAFEAVMVKHGSRGQVRSLLRAVAEVNAAEQQFDSAWVEPFNRAIRQMLSAQT